MAASLAARAQVEDTGYGYYWWRPRLWVATPGGGGTRVTLNAAQGNGGQKIYLVPADVAARARRRAPRHTPRR